MRKKREVKNYLGIEEQSSSGDCKDDFTNNKGQNREIKNSWKRRNGILMEIIGVVVYTNMVVKMKPRLSSYREFRTH